MIDVDVPWLDLRNAGRVGIDRYIRILAANRPMEHGEDRENWNNHILGAMGECAVARTLDIYWAGDLGHPDGHAPDVGPYHVRTGRRPTDRLLLHDRDPDAGMFLLVVKLRLPRFRIVGWCYGHEGKTPAYIDEPQPGRPCYCVPQPTLRALDSLASHA